MESVMINLDERIEKLHQDISETIEEANRSYSAVGNERLSQLMNIFEKINFLFDEAQKISHRLARTDRRLLKHLHESGIMDSLLVNEN